MEPALAIGDAVLGSEPPMQGGRTTANRRSFRGLAFGLDQPFRECLHSLGKLRWRAKLGFKIVQSCRSWQIAEHAGNHEGIATGQIVDARRQGRADATRADMK